MAIKSFIRFVPGDNIFLFQPTYGGIRQELGRLQFPPGESPRVSRMYIYAGTSLTECQAPTLPTPRYPCLHHETIQVFDPDMTGAYVIKLFCP